MLRKVFLTGVVALVAVVPGQAGEGRELWISGSVVQASVQALSVENFVGDTILTCTVPGRLAAKAAALKTRDRIQMVCVRYNGRRAELVTVRRLGEKAEEKQTDERTTDEKKTEEKRLEKQEASGVIAELGPGAIVVQGDKRLACRVPAEKQAKLEGLSLGDKVRISCIASVLAGVERAPAAKPTGQEVRLYGKISALSRERVTVQGEAGTLSCTVPAGLAEKVVARFAVGDSVKLMCRGSELTYLEKTA